MSKIDPQKVALVFPGQGSQQIGMGEEICTAEPDAQNAFRLVAQECDFDLLKTAWVGPEEALKRTNHAQPALLATSAACLQALRRYWPAEPFCYAGHSLGELSALWAAGTLTLAAAAFLTARRGQLMNEAPPGAMAAVLGIEAEPLKELCQSSEVVIANYNTPQQMVISGPAEAVKESSAKLSELSRGKVIPLAVGGAFHSPLMQEANQRFQEALEQVNFQEPQAAVVQNVSGKAHRTAAELKSNLSKQMISAVWWTQSVQTMRELGVEVFIEVGSGKVLSGLIKKIDSSAKVLQVADSGSLQATLQELGA